MRRTLVLIVGIALGAGGGAACKQGINDRCQVNSDCDSDFCLIPAGGSPAVGGSCQEKGGPTPEVDAAPPDAATADGGPTDGGPTDGAPTDGGPTDGGPTDGGADGGG